jgi:tetratricopeptide (TPR) repeat protein
MHGEGRQLLARYAFIAWAVLTLAVSVCYADQGASQDPSMDSMLMSSIHVWKGDQHEQGGRPDRAAEDYVKAASHLRTSPSPHFALARIYLRRSLMDAFLELATGLKLLISDFFYQSVVVSNLLVILIIALSAAFYISVITIVLRHAKALWLAGIISIPPGLKGSYPQIIIMASVLSFFLLVSGRSILSIITWTTVVGCALVWRFTSESEKRTIVGFAVFLIVIGLLTGFTGKIVFTQHPESPLRTAALADRIAEDRLRNAFAGSDRKSKYDPIVDFMRGYLLLRSGEYELSIERMNLASKFAPDNPAILNNLGVAYHGMARYQHASAKFQEALRLAPREALIHYNYSQTLNAMLHYDLAQEELAEASALDFDLTRSLVTKKESGAPVPMNLQTRVLWQLALDYGDREIGLNYHPIESGVAGTVILIILAAAAVALMRKAKCPARCEVCGCLVGTQMTKRKRRDRLCPTCHKTKVINAGSHRELESAYERRLRRLATRTVALRLILGLMIPGTAHHLAGKRFTGFVTSAVVIALFIAGISGGAVIRIVPALKTEMTITWALPVFLIVYAIYAWRSCVTAIRSVKEA